MPNFKFNNGYEAGESTESNTLHMWPMPVAWDYLKVKQFIKNQCESTEIKNASLYIFKPVEGQDSESLYVRFSTPYECHLAHAELQGMELNGKKVQVEFNIPTKPTFLNQNYNSNYNYYNNGYEQNDYSPETYAPTPTNPEADEGPPSLETFGLSVGFLTSLDIQPPLRNKVFVSNVYWNVPEAEIRSLMSVAGHVVTLTMMYSPKGEPVGKVVVEYDHPVEAVQAISMLHGQEFHCRPLVVVMYKFNTELLPRGLTKVGLGLGPGGNPLKAVRTAVEILPIKKQLEKLMQIMSGEIVTDDSNTPYGSGVIDSPNPNSFGANASYFGAMTGAYMPYTADQMNGPFMTMPGQDMTMNGQNLYMESNMTMNGQNPMLRQNMLMPGPNIPMPEPIAPPALVMPVDNSIPPSPVISPAITQNNLITLVPPLPDSTVPTNHHAIKIKQPLHPDKSSLSKPVLPPVKPIKLNQERPSESKGLCQSETSLATKEKPIKAKPEWLVTLPEKPKPERPFQSRTERPVTFKHEKVTSSRQEKPSPPKQVKLLKSKLERQTTSTRKYNERPATAKQHRPAISKFDERPATSKPESPVTPNSSPEAETTYTDIGENKNNELASGFQALLNGKDKPTLDVLQGFMDQVMCLTKAMSALREIVPKEKVIDKPPEKRVSKWDQPPTPDFVDPRKKTDKDIVTRRLRTPKVVDPRCRPDKNAGTQIVEIRTPEFASPGSRPDENAVAQIEIRTPEVVDPRRRINKDAVTQREVVDPRRRPAKDIAAQTEDNRNPEFIDPRRKPAKSAKDLTREVVRTPEFVDPRRRPVTDTMAQKEQNPKVKNVLDPRLLSRQNAVARKEYKHAIAVMNVSQDAQLMPANQVSRSPDYGEKNEYKRSYSDEADPAFDHSASKLRRLDDLEQSPPSTDMLIFSNLPPTLSVSALSSKMLQVGALRCAELSPRGRALVRFQHAGDARRCIQLFHRSKVDGQVIQVKPFY